MHDDPPAALSATAAFDAHVQGWRDWQRSPGGRLRYRLVAQLLDRHSDALESGATVLDVGGADGADSVRLARRPQLATDDAVLMVDGIFLHRPELRDAWDWSVFVRVPFATSVPRGASRGYGHPDPAHPSNQRYVEGQRLYLSACDPEGKADVVIDNTDLARPIVVRTR